MSVRKSYWVASPHNTQNYQVRHGSRLYVQWQTRLLLHRGQSLAQPLLVVCGGCSDHQQVQTTNRCCFYESTGCSCTRWLDGVVQDGKRPREMLWIMNIIYCLTLKILFCNKTSKDYRVVVVCANFDITQCMHEQLFSSGFTVFFKGVH